MIYDLSKRKWKSYVFMAGILFVPFCVASIIGTILDFSITMLIVTLCSIFVYAIIIVFLKIKTNKEGGLIFLKEDTLKIMDKDVNIELHFDEIIQIEYYRLTSIKVWILISAGGCYPKEASIIYYDKNHPYNKERKFYCYLDYKDAKEIAKRTNTKLKVY